MHADGRLGLTATATSRIARLRFAGVNPGFASFVTGLLAGNLHFQSGPLSVRTGGDSCRSSGGSTGGALRWRLRRITLVS
jgi:hypothetical protein